MCQENGLVVLIYMFGYRVPWLPAFATFSWELSSGIHELTTRAASGP